MLRCCLDTMCPVSNVLSRAFKAVLLPPGPIAAVALHDCVLPEPYTFWAPCDPSVPCGQDCPSSCLRIAGVLRSLLPDGTGCSGAVCWSGQSSLLQQPASGAGSSAVVGKLSIADGKRDRQKFQGTAGLLSTAPAEAMRKYCSVGFMFMGFMNCF